jgi:hypothetical protein
MDNWSTPITNNLIIMNNVEVYQEGNVWLVRYTEDGVEKISEPFFLEEDAITFSLNLKFI